MVTHSVVVIMVMVVVVAELYIMVVKSRRAVFVQVDSTHV